MLHAFFISASFTACKLMHGLDVVRLVPTVVLSGFMSGIGFIIFLTQFPPLLGLPAAPSAMVTNLFWWSSISISPVHTLVIPFLVVSFSIIHVLWGCSCFLPMEFFTYIEQEWVINPHWRNYDSKSYLLRPLKGFTCAFPIIGRTEGVAYNVWKCQPPCSFCWLPVLCFVLADTQKDNKVCPRVIACFDPGDDTCIQCKFE